MILARAFCYNEKKKIEKKKERGKRALKTHTISTS